MAAVDAVSQTCLKAVHKSALFNPVICAFSALTLLVEQQAWHPVTCTNLRPLIHLCFDAVGWMRRRTSCL